MSDINLTVFDPALWENYIGVTYDTTIRRSQLLDLFKENSKVHDGPQGKYFKFNDMLGGNQGIGSRLEGEFLPDGDTVQMNNPIAYLKTHYARTGDATYQSMVDAVQSKTAFGNFAKLVLTPLVQNLGDDLDRQACGFAAGAFCRIDTTNNAIVTGVNGSASIDTAFGANNLSGVNVTTKGWISGIARGMRIVAGPNLDGSSLRSGGQSAKVTSVNFLGNNKGGSVTFDNVPVDWANNDYLFRGDQYGTNTQSGGTDREMMGLEGLIDDGNLVQVLETIDRTTTPEWASPLIDASAAPYSGAFTDGLAMTAITNAGLYGGGKVRAFVTGVDEWRQAYNAIRGLGGFGAQRDTAEGSMGQKGITIDTPVGSLNLRAVERIVPGRAYAIDPTVLHRFVDGTGDWVKTTGTMWQQVRSGAAVKDAFFAYYRTRMQLASDNPRKCVKIVNINSALY